MKTKEKEKKLEGEYKLYINTCTYTCNIKAHKYQMIRDTSSYRDNRFVSASFRSLIRGFRVLKNLKLKSSNETILEVIVQNEDFCVFLVMSYCRFCI